MPSPVVTPRMPRLLRHAGNYGVTTSTPLLENRHLESSVSSHFKYGRLARAAQIDCGPPGTGRNPFNRSYHQRNQKLVLKVRETQPRSRSKGVPPLEVATVFCPTTGLKFVVMGPKKPL